MKKVININFQGRVIPIEETSYEILKQYIESLRRYFAKEEGMNEIVNDIESRIAELFGEQLKKGSACITDEHINSIIASMGRPEDFDAETADSTATAKDTSSQQNAYSNSSAGYVGPDNSSTGQNYSGSSNYGTGSNQRYGQSRGKFVRNDDDKIIGGVCSGLANYFGIDPVIMRILFVVLFGAIFWVYILLWVIVPSQSLETNITRRLYRSADDKVIGGVASGLAAYFNVDIWVPRLIFALPLILGVVSGTFNALWWDWDFGFVPRMVTGSLGSTLFLTYIILWIAVPVATTAAEKLQMRGERVDLNSIRDTVKNDMGSFRNRAEKWGEEVKQTATQFGERAKKFGEESGTYAKRFSGEAAPLAKKAGNGIGHIIGVLFKVFFLFIAAMIALSLFGVLVALLFGGFTVFPFKNFILEGTWENLLAWSTLLFFLGVPVIALITWLIRRIAGARSKNHYLGYVFGSLWTIGLISMIVLIATFGRNFKTRSGIEDAMPLVQPSTGKLMIDVERNNLRYYSDDWYGIEWDEDMPFYGSNEDTLMLNTVRVNVVKSKDDQFHIYRVRFSRSNGSDAAKELAGKIQFDIKQQDSLITLPRGFGVSKDEKFRNQQVLMIVEVPVGKRIQLQEGVRSYDWFTVNFNRRRGINVEVDNEWDNSYSWNAGQEYEMTPGGLERTDYRVRDYQPGGKYYQEQNKVQIDTSVIDGRKNRTNEEKTPQPADNRYRYRQDARDRIDTVTRRTVVSELAIPVAALANIL